MRDTLSLRAPGVIFALMTALFFTAGAGAEAARWDVWTSGLQSIDEQLRAGEWEAATPRIEALAAEMANGSGATRAYQREHVDDLDLARVGQGYLAEGIGLARAAAYLALARAAADRGQEARWYWYAAQNLDQRWVKADLEPYGEAGAFLARHRIKPAAEQVSEIDILDPVVPEGADGARFDEPERLRVIYPLRPKDVAAMDRFSEALFVQVTVERDGTLTQPILVDGHQFPSVVYRAFEALAHWHYAPATYDGEPIPFRYVVPVVFKDDRPEQSAVFF